MRSFSYMCLCKTSDPWGRVISEPRAIICTILVNIKGLSLLVSDKIFKVLPIGVICKTI